MMSRKNNDPFNAMSFPSKMHTMLEDAEPRGFEDVIAWQPGGKSFKVYQPERFTQEVMPLYFAQTKFKSFQRQLNIYGWRKVHHGPNKGGYLHKFFVQGKLELCSRIIRRTSKDFNNPADKHHFSSIMESLAAPVVTTTTTTDSAHQHSAQQSMDLNETEVKSFFDFFYPEATTENAMIGSILTSALTASIDDCASTTTIESSQWSATAQDLDGLHLNEQYFDNVLELFLEDGENHNNGADKVYSHHEELKRQEHPPTMVHVDGEDSSMDDSYHSHSSTEEEEDELESDHSFPFKLHLMLENAERDNYQHVVSWVKDGSAFKVHNNKEFVRKVLPIYFDQSKYESFRRQLNLYGFQRVPRGADRGVIAHPHMRQGARQWCKEIKRKTQAKAVAGMTMAMVDLAVVSPS